MRNHARHVVHEARVLDAARWWKNRHDIKRPLMKSAEVYPNIPQSITVHWESLIGA